MSGIEAPPQKLQKQHPYQLKIVGFDGTSSCSNLDELPSFQQTLFNGFLVLVLNANVHPNLSVRNAQKIVTIIRISNGHNLHNNLNTRIKLSQSFITVTIQPGFDNWGQNFLRVNLVSMAIMLGVLVVRVR